MSFQQEEQNIPVNIIILLKILSYYRKKISFMLATSSCLVISSENITPKSLNAESRIEILFLEVTKHLNNQNVHALKTRYCYLSALSSK